MDKLKCLNCGSENLVYYKEMLSVYATPLTKNNKIPKKEHLLYKDGNFPNHIDCQDCKTFFNYEIDKDGQIHGLWEL